MPSTVDNYNIKTSMVNFTVNFIRFQQLSLRLLCTEDVLLNTEVSSAKLITLDIQIELVIHLSYSTGSCF